MGAKKRFISFLVMLAFISILAMFSPFVQSDTTRRHRRPGREKTGPYITEALTVSTIRA